MSDNLLELIHLVYDGTRHEVRKSGLFQALSYLRGTGTSQATAVVLPRRFDQPARRAISMNKVLLPEQELLLLCASVRTGREQRCAELVRQIADWHVTLAATYRLSGQHDCEIVFPSSLKGCDISYMY